MVHDLVLKWWCKITKHFMLRRLLIRTVILCSLSLDPMGASIFISHFCFCVLGKPPHFSTQAIILVETRASYMCQGNDKSKLQILEPLDRRNISINMYWSLFEWSFWETITLSNKITYHAISIIFFLFLP